MPHQSWADENQNPKTFFRQYLRNIDEPRSSITTGSSPELRNELIEDSYIMKRRFRLIAKTLRDYF